VPVSAAARAEEWRHQLGRAFGGLEPEAHDPAYRADLPGHGLDGTMSSAPLGRTGVFSVSGTPQVVRRTRRAIAAAPMDPLKICIQLAGSAVIHQAEREVRIEPGELAVYDTGRPYDLRLSGRWTCAVVTVPRDAVNLTGQGLDDAMRHTFSVTAGPGLLLTSLADVALQQAATAPEDDPARYHLGEASIELVASILDGVRADPGTDADADRTRQAVLGYVRAHLRDPGLSHAMVAAAHHMSPRTLNRLFEGHEHTVTETIRRWRLDGARRELEDPRWRRCSVMAIAAHWGFHEQAHFTRLFKAQFGVTPAALRRAAVALH
jgi:AraC-like DNA-binding protein